METFWFYQQQHQIWKLNAGVRVKLTSFAINERGILMLQQKALWRLVEWKGKGRCPWRFANRLFPRELSKKNYLIFWAESFFWVPSMIRYFKQRLMTSWFGWRGTSRMLLRGPEESVQQALFQRAMPRFWYDLTDTLIHECWTVNIWIKQQYD